MKWEQYIRWVGAFLGSLAAFLWGGWDWWMWALIAFIIGDYVSGWTAAKIHNKLDSKKGFAGLLKKLLYLMIVAVGYIVDVAIHADGAIRGLVIGYLVANEGLSILENCARCGLPIPQKLINALEQLKGDDEKTE